MHEPFRCIACGAGNAGATRCPSCGSTAFELTRPPPHADADDASEAELVSLEAARDERARRRPFANSD